MHRSEKAVDTQICCDAIQLASLNKMARLFLYTNDTDFLPLIETLKVFGCNVSLIRLRNKDTNKKLAEESDSYHVMNESKILQAFAK